MQKILVFLLFVAVFLNVPSVHAQKTEGLSISPPSFEINANPGDVLTNTIKVENISDQPITIKAAARNFTAYGEGGQVEITEQGSSYAIASWITMDKASFIVQPKSTEPFTFQIEIPKNAEPGSHYGAVLFSTDNEAKANGSGAVLTQEIGSLILIKLPGNVYENAKIDSFKPVQTIFRDPKIMFNALVDNTGNVHIKPYGFITIRNILGVKTQTIEIRGQNILPRTKRLFEETSSFEHIGIYRAELTLLYSGGKGLLKEDTTFIALNQNKLLKYLAIIVTVLVLYFVFRKRINKALGILLKGQ